MSNQDGNMQQCLAGTERINPVNDHVISALLLQVTQQHKQIQSLLTLTDRTKAVQLYELHKGDHILEQDQSGNSKRYVLLDVSGCSSSVFIDANAEIANWKTIRDNIEVRRLNGNHFSVQSNKESQLKEYFEKIIQQISHIRGDIDTLQQIYPIKSQRKSDIQQQTRHPEETQAQQKMKEEIKQLPIQEFEKSSVNSVWNQQKKPIEQILKCQLIVSRQETFPVHEEKPEKLVEKELKTETTLQIAQYRKSTTPQKENEMVYEWQKEKITSSLLKSKGSSYRRSAILFLRPDY